jgi:acetylornithine deacetylase/succinyl-diaminopimelate desuccinylase-like protein
VEREARDRGLRLDVVRLEGRTPVILMDVPGASDETVLLYGHCDKQPEMVGWADGLGPWTPVRKGDRLFGRGVGDDGYATFSALSAIEALQAARVPHARCVVLIEACEESGSYDLPFYIDALAAKIGTPNLVVCLDSGCGTYDRLWGTTSLRGIVNGELTVQVLGEGVHSGAASGIVPSSFRILRQLLSRLEDEVTGEIRPATST